MGIHHELKEVILYLKARTPKLFNFPNFLFLLIYCLILVFYHLVFSVQISLNFCYTQNFFTIIIKCTKFARKYRLATHWDQANFKRRQNRVLDCWMNFNIKNKFATGNSVLDLEVK